MKNKLLTPVSLIAIFLLFILSCGQLNEEGDHYDLPPPSSPPTTAIGAASRILMVNSNQSVNISDIKNLCSVNNINFTNAYREILNATRLKDELGFEISVFGPDDLPLNNYGRPSNKINLAVAFSYLNLTDYGSGYINEIYNIIPEEREETSLDNIGFVFEGINRVQNLVNTDSNLSSAERTHLNLMLKVYRENIQDIVDLVKREESGGIINSGRAGWLKKAWRKVRSIVVTTAVTAAVGGATLGPVGAIVGGIVGLIASTVDVVVNNRCHYAMKCDKGWVQDCSNWSVS